MVFTRFPTVILPRHADDQAPKEEFYYYHHAWLRVWVKGNALNNDGMKRLTLLSMVRPVICIMIYVGGTSRLCRGKL